MAYNLTGVESANNFPTLALELNSVANSWLFTSLLIMVMLIVVITMVKGGYKFSGSLFVSGLFGSVLGVLLIMTGAVEWTVVSIIFGITILSFTAFSLGD